MLRGDHQSQSQYSQLLIRDYKRISILSEKYKTQHIPDVINYLNLKIHLPPVPLLLDHAVRRAPTGIASRLPWRDFNEVHELCSVSFFRH